MKIAFTLFIIYLFSYSSFAQPGTLDSSFALNGINLDENSRPFCVATQKSGKIIVGVAAYSDELMGIGLLLYNVDGSKDGSFDKYGHAILNYDVANQVTFQLVLLFYRMIR